MSAFSYVYESLSSVLITLLLTLGALGLIISAFLLTNYYVQRWKARHGFFGRGAKKEKIIRFYNHLLFSDNVFSFYAFNSEKSFRLLHDLKSLTIFTFESPDFMIFEPFLFGLDFDEEIWLIRSNHISFPGLIKALGEKLEIDEQALLEARISSEATCLRIWSQADSNQFDKRLTG